MVNKYSPNAKKTISSAMAKSIEKFNESKFREIATRNGMANVSQDKFIKRVNTAKNHMKKSGRVLSIGDVLDFVYNRQ